jgi:hypothetical protein
MQPLSTTAAFSGDWAKPGSVITVGLQLLKPNVSYIYQQL